MDRTAERKVFATLGASNHGSQPRETHDYYATDPIAMELLLNEETFSKDIWECACGEGHLSRVLEAHGYNVKSTDLVERGFGESGVDFLAQTEQFDGDIITNPPYKYAKEFVQKAIESVTDGHKVAMFLKVQFLEGKARRELFEKHPPKYIYISTNRICCCRNGDFSPEQRKNNSAQAYAWYIWEKGFTGEPVVRWFN